MLIDLDHQERFVIARSLSAIYPATSVALRTKINFPETLQVLALTQEEVSHIRDLVLWHSEIDGPRYRILLGKLEETTQLPEKIPVRRINARRINTRAAG